MKEEVEGDHLSRVVQRHELPVIVEHRRARLSGLRRAGMQRSGYPLCKPMVHGVNRTTALRLVAALVLGWVTAQAIMALPWRSDRVRGVPSSASKPRGQPLRLRLRRLRPRPLRAVRRPHHARPAHRGLRATLNAKLEPGSLPQKFGTISPRSLMNSNCWTRPSKPLAVTRIPCPQSVMVFGLEARALRVTLVGRRAAERPG